MFKHSQISLERPGNKRNEKQVKGTSVLTAYKIAIGMLLLSLVIVSLLSFQQVNSIQVQNGQLLSHSIDLDQQNSYLHQIVTLGETQVLANRLALYWSAQVSKSLDLSCDCFQYSGYLHLNWTSPAGSVALRVVQFGLNLTTPSKSTGDFRIPISSSESFSVWFDFGRCYSSQCQATYSAVYHY